MREAPAISCHDAERLARCRWLRRQRRQLAKLMGAAGRQSPFLDMVLDLYVAELETRTLCQSSIENHAARASAHRHALALVDMGLAVRETDLRDRRRKTVKLARHLRKSLDQFMDALPTL